MMEKSETKNLKQAEIATLQTEERIISRFREESKISDRSPSAIMQDIAYEERYSLQGVRKLLIRSGEYTPKRKEADDGNEGNASS